MKRFTKSVAVMLSASMLMTLGACQDNSRNEVLDLAEDVAEYTVNRNYSKLSKLTEDGDEDLAEIFEAIEADDCREVVASTLEYEIDEDSLEKDGKTGYTIDVTFTYADYEDVLEMKRSTPLMTSRMLLTIATKLSKRLLLWSLRRTDQTFCS